jgi:two-component system C4-dicarboxylate transport sensor histidine kinase DctB
LEAINDQRVQLIASAVKAEVGRQDHLPVVLSLDSDVQEALTFPSDATRIDRLNRKLQRVSEEADTRALYVVGIDGKVLASDDWEATPTLVGRDLSSQPYFREAITKSKSSHLGTGAETNRVRFFLAEAARTAVLKGVVVVRIEFDALESAWERAGERVFLTDSDGIVFLSSDPAYKFRIVNTAAATPESALERARVNYPDVDVGQMEFTVLEKRQSASIVSLRWDGVESSYLYQSQLLPDFGWTIHRLAGLAEVRTDQRDGGIIGATLSALFISLLLYVVQRHHALVAAKSMGTQLALEVSKRTSELSDANASLRTEIDERRRAEAQLRETQNELVQAGKLAALGQMSAALAHEINQPLAAIRTFIASTKIFAQRGDFAQTIGNLDVITRLAERMASITSHLKMFARKSEPGHPEPVQVARAIEGALFLMDSQIKSAGVRIDVEVDSQAWVLGYTVQLEQVFVNLVQNAIDAVATNSSPSIKIVTSADNDSVITKIADNGPGIDVDVLDRIFDPFVTTKPMSKGLGLGLSISYGIVQELHGRIYASNPVQGGAEVTVELPRHKTQYVLKALSANA